MSYAKVWGETRKEKSDYLTQLHTDYHDEVGYKYGLERGIPYEELSDEEKREFALSDRCCDFNRQEALSVYYAIVALAQKQEISLDSNSGIKSATTQFLDGCNWSGTSQSRQDNCRSWTNLFTAREVEFLESVIGDFCAFVDHMSCSAGTYVSLGGANGCADQLTNWDGTQKQGLGAPKKKDKGMSM